MLTKDALIADARIAAANLPDDVLTAIATLSENDQKAVVGERDKELLNTFDELLEQAGFPRDKANKEKTSDAIKRVAQAAKDAVTEAGTLKTKIADVEKQIKDGNTDPALKTKLTDLEKQLGDKEASITEWKSKHKKDIDELNAKLAQSTEKNMAIRVDHEFSKALEGIVYKDEKLLSKEDRELIINAKKQNLLSKYDVEFIDDGKGGEVLAFRDKATKNIANNPANALNPFTARELLLNEITSIVDPGRNVLGTGKTPDPANPNNNGSFRLTGKNQVEADREIDKYLQSTGVDKFSQDFIDQKTQLRKDWKVTEMPEQ